MIKKLIAVARTKGIPVIYTTGVRRDDGWDQGAWAFKNTRVRKDYLGLKPNQLKSNVIVPEIAPAERTSL